MVWDFGGNQPPVVVRSQFRQSCGLGSRRLSRVWVLVLRGICENSWTPHRRPQAKDSRLIATDPPYYDNVGYAHLSDFFYVWLRLYAARPLF